MSEIKFRSRVEIFGINPYVRVTAANARRLAIGWRRPMPVLVRLGAHPQVWRTHLTPLGDGSFRLHLHGAMRKCAGIEVGDRVEIVLCFDVAYRGGPAHPMPTALRQELSHNERARIGWARLSPSLQKEVLRYLAALKSTEALERNIRRAVHVLCGGKARFLARSWNESEGRGPKT